jgi:ribonuclease BN (tRNA processing enzyme)
MVSYSNQNQLWDAGEGVSEQILKYGYDKNFIDDILITHFHPDHISGIFMLLQMLYLQGRTKKLRIFIPEDINFFQSMLENLYLFPKKFNFTLEIYNLKNVKRYLPEIELIPNDHLKKYKKMPSQIAHSYKNHSIFLSAEKKILYTSDIPNFSSLQYVAAEADIIVLDALHPRYSEIVYFIENTKARVILNHGVPEEFKNAKYETADENKIINI